MAYIEALVKAFKMTHIKVNSIHIWLRYQAKTDKNIVPKMVAAPRCLYYTVS